MNFTPINIIHIVVCAGYILACAAIIVSLAVGIAIGIYNLFKTT